MSSDGTIKTDPRTGLEFVHLPGGKFHYGCEVGDKYCADDEKPGRTVKMAPFWLAKTTVTVAAYKKCVDADVCETPGSDEPCHWHVQAKISHPVNCLSWKDANNFCQWIGGRLPTAEEWEYAAKGGESRIYPWGNTPPDDGKARFGLDDTAGTAPADSYGGGASKHGLLNMAGNILQWTASDYDDGHREIRGSSWRSAGPLLRASNRRWADESINWALVGVRCAL